MTQGKLFFFLILIFFQVQVFAAECEMHLIGTKPLSDWFLKNVDQKSKLVTFAFKGDDHPLWQHWKSAVGKMDDFEKFANQPDVGLYFKEIFDASVATLTKHQMVFVDQMDLRKLDVPRHLEILRMIANFDHNRPKLSAYKIKRAIEGRHSLMEYTNCL